MFLDSLQSNNLPTISEYITANEVNLCLHIQAFQECVHSQSYSYMLDSICSPEKRNEILYQWKTDEHLLKRNTFIGNCYNEFQESQDGFTLMKTLIANYILEGIYFYSGFMFFYNLSRNGKMSGSAQEIRYINRDENTHLWLFRNIILELKKEEPDLFTPDKVKIYEYMMREGVKQEIEWGQYVIGDNIQGLNRKMIEDYIQYLGNLRWSSLGFGPLYEENHKEPESMHWVSQYSNANMVKTDFLKQRVRLMPKVQLWKMTYNPFTKYILLRILNPLRYGAINGLTETFPLKTINKQLPPPLSHSPPHPLYKNVFPELHMLSVPGID